MKKRKELHVQSTSLGAVHMKIVFPLFSRLIGEKILFPCVHMSNVERQQKTFIMLSLRISAEKRIRKKLKTLYRNKKRDAAGSSKEEIKHGGPI